MYDDISNDIMYVLHMETISSVHKSCVIMLSLIKSSVIKVFSHNSFVML